MDVHKCKLCRKTGKKLFIKGARCYSPKCALAKRPFPPGPAPKRMTSITDYGREFSEKQKMKFWYGLREAQFKKYVKGVLENLFTAKIKADDSLIRALECRLDSVVFRMGLATSLKQARKLVSHGHILLNGKKVNVASAVVKLKDKVSVSEKTLKKSYFQKLLPEMKKFKAPAWVKVDINTLEGELAAYPTAEEVALPIQISSIFEHYSK